MTKVPDVGAAVGEAATDEAVMRSDEAGETYAAAVHPESSRGRVRGATGWDAAFAADVTETRPPGEDGIRLIREELDPDGVYADGGG